MSPLLVVLQQLPHVFCVLGKSFSSFLTFFLFSFSLQRSSIAVVPLASAPTFTYKASLFWDFRPNGGLAHLVKGVQTFKTREGIRNLDLSPVKADQNMQLLTHLRGALVGRAFNVPKVHFDRGVQGPLLEKLTAVASQLQFMVVGSVTEATHVILPPVGDEALTFMFLLERLVSNFCHCSFQITPHAMDLVAAITTVLIHLPPHTRQSVHERAHVNYLYRHSHNALLCRWLPKAPTTGLECQSHRRPTQLGLSVCIGGADQKALIVGW
jgi:hypothetical protein